MPAPFRTTPRGRSAVRLLVAELALAAGLAGPAEAQAPPVEPGGSLSVVHAAAVTGPLTVSIDGIVDRVPLAFVAARPAMPASAGWHYISVRAAEGSTSAAVDVEPGCVVSVLVFRPGGPGRPLALQPRAECPVPPVDEGRASVRLLAASVSAGALTVASGSHRASADAGAASERIPAPAGASALLLTRAGSAAVWRSVTVNLVARRAYDLLVAGDGDTPVVTSLIEVAEGPEHPIPADVVVATGGSFPADVVVATGGSFPAATPAVPAWLVGAAVAAVVNAGIAVALFGRGRSRSPVLAAAALMLLGASGCGSTGPSRSATAGKAGPAATAPTAARRSGYVDPPALIDAASSVARTAPVRIVGPGLDAPIFPYTNEDLPFLAARLGPTEVAWVDGMAAPGSRGFAVLAGHVSWGPDPAVFGGLGAMPVGAQLDVLAADGTWTRWVVEGATVVKKGVLPAWLSAPQPFPRLALVTCDGPVVDHSHVNNLLVVAHREAGR